jgi:hypothetical protein
MNPTSLRTTGRRSTGRQLVAESVPELKNYHQRYLSDAKNPDGCCGLGGTCVRCPIGLTRAEG